MILRVVKPDLHGYLGERRVQEGYEVVGDTGARRGSHLVDDLLGVLVEELVHGLADDVVAVYSIVYAKLGPLQAEVHQETSYPHVSDAIAFLLHALDTSHS